MVNEAVGEDAETNIIFGAVSDPTMNGKIRVTVIATGFNEQSMIKKREERPMVLAVPGVRKEAEKSAEQMSMPLQFTLRQERPLEVLDDKEEEGQPVGEVEAMAQPPVVATTTTASGAPANSPSIDFPPFLKPEAMRREQRVYINRGTVMTQYEDDTDIPTFLRKQMQ
jgi:cell division protein FtsZ